MQKLKPDVSFVKYKWSNAPKKKKKEPQQKQKEPKIRSLKVYVQYTYALNIHYSSMRVVVLLFFWAAATFVTNSNSPDLKERRKRKFKRT